jgi:T5SS/PEP-CTERM-associated repeat protein
MADVTGVGSKWSSSGLRVGNAGVGKLTISAGGQVESVAGFIGYLLGSTGEVKVWVLALSGLILTLLKLDLWDMED